MGRDRVASRASLYRMRPQGEAHTCVAQMTGFPARLHRPIIIFWARKTFSAGISMPRSPRATMIPSLASRISSNLRGKLRRQRLYIQNRGLECGDTVSRDSDLVILATRTGTHDIITGVFQLSQSSKGGQQFCSLDSSAPGRTLH